MWPSGATVAETHNLKTAYRPADLDGLYGLDSVVSGIKQVFSSRKVPPTWLFHGDYGCGKTTLSRIVAKSILCTSPNAEGTACCSCESCLAFDKNSHPYYYELNSKSDGGVDAVRAQLQLIQYRPSYFGCTKIVINYDEAHLLTRDACSNLLKPVEEPPEHVVWMFCTNKPHEMDPALISRMHRVRVHAPAPEAVLRLVTDIAFNEGIQLSEAAATTLVAAAECNPRQSLQLLQEGSASNRLDTATGVQSLVSTTPYMAAVALVRDIASGSFQEVPRTLYNRNDCMEILKSVPKVFSRVTTVLMCGSLPNTWEGKGLDTVVPWVQSAPLLEVFMQAARDFEACVDRAMTYRTDVQSALQNTATYWALQFAKTIAATRPKSA